MTKKKVKKPIIPLVRVHMSWPPELKERVMEIAGERRLTEFVIAAVQKELELIGKNAKPVPPPLPKGYGLPRPAPAQPQGPVLPPEPELLEPQGARCKNCGEVLVVGECWTCG